MNKAVKWAIDSAMKLDCPSLTAFVLPQWEDHAYYKWMSHPLVYPLLMVPASQFKFKKPDFWRSADTEYAKSPRWNVNIFIVANAAGLHYIDPDLLVTKLREASLEI